MSNDAVDNLCIELIGDNFIKTPDGAIDLRRPTTICVTGTLTTQCGAQTVDFFHYAALSIEDCTIRVHNFTGAYDPFSRLRTHLLKRIVV